MITPIKQQCNGAFSATISLIPLFTPVMMLMRQTMEAGVPAWQPWVGLAGIAITTVVISWVTARLFRVVILQVKSPKPASFSGWLYVAKRRQRSADCLVVGVVDVGVGDAGAEVDVEV
ncbi:MAG TPA: hypothetical protein VHC90_03705 [Bryobacteraceae bacterium]|nr:hypothetical protein [Bryobacteraceae bacterium]